MVSQPFAYLKKVFSRITAFGTVFLAIVALYGPLAATFHATGSRATGSSPRMLAAPWTLQGRVYAGETGTEPPTSTALSDVTVRLSCATNLDSQGEVLASSTTDSSGLFTLTTSRACEVYNIIETDPAGYTSVGATSVGGTVKTSNWIQYLGNLDTKTLTGNKFWDRLTTTSTTCSSCSDCSSKLNGSYSTVQLANDINTTASSCVLFGASNIKFDCAGHLIATTATGTEFGYGIKVAGKSGVTVQNCSISGFDNALWMDSTTKSAISSNTAAKNGNALFISNHSDNNTLKSNQFTQNNIGVYMVTSDSNAFSGNILCKQKSQDIYAHDSTSGNTLSGDKCDYIWNWNGDKAASYCTQTCTSSATTNCSGSSACASALNGDYGTVTLGGNLSLPGGLTITGNHLTLDCNNYTLSGNKSGAGIILNQKIGVTLKNCKVTGYNTGIELRSASLNVIDNATATGNGTGIALLSPTSAVLSQKNTIKNSTITKNTNYGISLADSRNNSILTNDLSNNGLYALWVSGECSNTVTGCIGGSGGAIYYAHDQTSLSLTSGMYDLVYLCNVTGGDLANLTVSNGNAKNDGIVLIDSGTTNIHKNKVTSANGIWIENSTGIKIYENTVSSNRDDGITLYKSSNAQVYDNTVTSNTGYGISIASGRGQVYGNTVQSNTGGGIEVENSPGATVRDNTVSKNVDSKTKSGDGIAITHSTGVAISENKVDHHMNGLYFDNATSTITVNNNEICYNSGKDIYNNGLTNTGDDNTCAVTYRWNDTGESSDCTKQCIGWYNRKWGFSFKNPSLDDISYTRFAQTFGEDEVYYTAKICIGAPICIPFKCWCLGYEAEVSTGIRDLLAVIFYEAIWKDLAEPGECFGMSTKSLQFFYGNDYVANYGASGIQDLAEDSSLGTVSFRNKREISHGSQLSSELINSYLKDVAAFQNRAMPVLDKVRAALTARKPNMVSIKDGLTSGHVMNYDTVVDVDSNTSRIYVYDSNQPEYTYTVPADPTNLTSGYPAIIIDKSKYTGTLSGDNSWTCDRRDGRVWGNDMIFDVPYSLVNRSDWTMPASISGLGEMIFGDSGIKGNVEDMNGRLLGYDSAGKEHEEITGGMGYPIWGATNPNIPAILLVPPADYNFNVIGKAGTYSQALFGIGGGYLLEKISATANTRDRLELRLVNKNPLNQELAFRTNDSDKAFILNIYRGADPKSDRRAGGNRRRR